MRTVYLGFGSNLGDRQANILQALQRLRLRARIEAVSSYYETQPAAGIEGPAFLNVAAELATELEPEALVRFLREVEIAVGRLENRHLAARPIDIDLLLVGELVCDFGSFEVPHPYLAERPFNLIPLAEIAPELVEPRSGRTIRELAAAADSRGIEKKERSLHFFANRQEGEPDVKFSIDRAGVSRIKRIVHLQLGGVETVFNGEFAMVADLAPDRAGVHMSRFSELLEEATLEVLAHEKRAGLIEDVVSAIAREIVGSQRALRADVRLRAEFGLERWTPVSGKRGEETYTLVGIAHADERGVRRVVGVEAEGMTACPCAQLMMREHSVRELLEAGFSEAEAARALDALPVATHNQRGRGTILVGVPEGAAPSGAVRAEDLVEIVESAMSSETYDLLKRPDEFFVVNKAHRNPKFVEDVVRGMLARALDVYGDLPDGAFVAASQTNYESIHKHDAFAEANGTFGELREELRSGLACAHKTELAGWLGTRPSPVLA
ncbi:MAG: GTP cyclohydrolase MptA [Vulcanimicrobiaceae bacterium]